MQNEWGELEPGPAGGVRFQQQVQVTGRCCGKEGHSPGARAGRRLVPGGKVQFFCQMSLTFILMSAGSSELVNDRIKVVFIEYQSGWASGEDISEQSKWGTERDIRTTGQRESVDVSRSLRAGNDVISPSTLQRGCSHQHASRGLVSPACKKRKGTGTQRAREHCLLSPPLSMGPRA